MESNQQVHIAYDERAIDAAFASVFGQEVSASVAPKTTKTYCGKRVAFKFAQTRDAANCATCLELHAEQKAADSTLLDEMIATWPANVPLPAFLANREAA